jgi:hypothetical protein
MQKVIIVNINNHECHETLSVSHLNNQFIDPSKCLHQNAKCSFVGFKSCNHVHYITNLTSHDLIMETV